MKCVIHKLPIAGLALLSLMGCHRRGIDDMSSMPVRDTVVVLRYVHPSMYSGRKIWMADKHGNEFYCNNVSLGPKPAVVPNSGDEIFIERGKNMYGTDYIMVLENITAQKIKDAYVNER